MEPFTVHRGIVAPLDRANVDTDLIIPKQFLKSVERTGFGPNLFDQLRYQDEGQPGMDNGSRQLKTDFVLNRQRYKDASVLLCRENFGCGSSREHAPWALLDFGFRVLIAPSYADIFYNNCFKNGILPIVLAESVVASLFDLVEKNDGFSLKIDLPNQQISPPSGEAILFDIDPFRKECLLNGFDDIDLTLKNADLIKQYEQNRKDVCPWLFADLEQDTI